MLAERPAAEYLNRKILEGKTIAEKLDSLIELTFLHLESCQSSGQLSENVQILLGRLLMDVLKYQLVQFASRLDPDRSGILTTLCDHSFQCPYVSKWTYLSCQYYESLLAEAQSKVDRSVSEVVEKAVTSGLQDIKDKLENCT
ncbi:uncharacterized protein [Arachis hypogaea]|uniref:uncharacterized protein isoform X4 n=1 Tax=Arachis hypogaea TaxID=3818 RepID=UPI000A2C379B|nr:uncharacterized protein LOC112801388 isoform X6 [Arachis hypogaea]